MRYTALPQQIEAIFFDGKNFDEIFKVFPEGFIFENSNISVRGNIFFPGSWVCKDVNMNYFFPEKEALFPNRYQNAEYQISPGEAVEKFIPVSALNDTSFHEKTVLRCLDIFEKLLTAKS